MAETQSYDFTRTLGYLISKVKQNLKMDDGNDINFYNYAEDFLRDLNSDTFPRIKEYRADTPIDNNVIIVPTDWNGWTKIGYESGSQVVPLGNNDNLAFNSKIEISPSSDNNDDELTLPDTFYNLYWPSQIPRTPVPTFRVSYRERKIYIDPMVKIPNFYMEYISSCLDIEDGLLVHPFYQTGLMLHLQYWISMHTPTRRQDAPTYKMLLDSETERYRDRTAPTSLDIITAFHRVMY